jgi:hypothetical protein
MHWWHAAHFALWGRIELLERSMPFYRNKIPVRGPAGLSSRQRWSADGDCHDGCRLERMPREKRTRLSAGRKLDGPLRRTEADALIIFSLRSNALLAAITGVYSVGWSI